MVIKLVEIYEEQNFSEKKYKLREVFINPEHIVCLRDEPRLKALLSEGRLPEGMDSRQEFTRVYMNRGQSGLDVVVVGAPQVIEDKIGETKKQILKG
jgi:hypothetical protein|tara:strand:- start:60 stop:350 length:291 start_codon:yes stop_codon:yes gene_type:complete